MRAIKNIRLKNYDYSTSGYYFITICTHYQKSFLIDSSVLKIVEQSLDELKNISGVKLDYFVIMPDHLHMILNLESCCFKLGEIVRRFKARVSKESGRKIWQPNYYEHIIRNKNALAKIREYIVNNPMIRQIEFEKFYQSKSG